MLYGSDFKAGVEREYQIVVRSETGLGKSRIFVYSGIRVSGSRLPHPVQSFWEYHLGLVLNYIQFAVMCPCFKATVLPSKQCLHILFSYNCAPSSTIGRSEWDKLD